MKTVVFVLVAAFSALVCRYAETCPVGCFKFVGQTSHCPIGGVLGPCSGDVCEFHADCNPAGMTVDVKPTPYWDAVVPAGVGSGYEVSHCIDITCSQTFRCTCQLQGNVKRCLQAPNAAFEDIRTVMILNTDLPCDGEAP